MQNLLLSVLLAILSITGVSNVTQQPLDPHDTLSYIKTVAAEASVLVNPDENISPEEYRAQLKAFVEARKTEIANEMTQHNGEKIEEIYELTMQVLDLVENSDLRDELQDTVRAEIVEQKQEMAQTRETAQAMLQNMQQTSEEKMDEGHDKAHTYMDNAMQQGEAEMAQYQNNADIIMDTITEQVENTERVGNMVEQHVTEQVTEHVEQAQQQSNGVFGWLTGFLGGNNGKQSGHNH